MPHVTVLILHPGARPADGPLARGLATARAERGRRPELGFQAVGADDVRLVSGDADDTTFGRRLRDLVPTLGRAGVVILGSGSLALADARDRRAFVAVAASGEPRALANNRYSADALAVGRADLLDGIPDLRADNALPRWLASRPDVMVDDLDRRWRLAVDLDSPLDVILVAGAAGSAGWARRAVAGMPVAEATARLEAVRQVASDPRAELLIAGRSSSRTLAWVERRTASRTRFLSEERGLRASEPIDDGVPDAPQRPPRSILGMQLDAAGPEALGGIVAGLADAALVDLRVLLAHRYGTDEADWPGPEDRFAADLLLADRIADPWLRALTRSAASAPVPVVLGGHTLVGPGVRLAIGRPLGTGDATAPPARA
jgi:hypothetical protein